MSQSAKKLDIHFKQSVPKGKINLGLGFVRKLLKVCCFCIIDVGRNVTRECLFAYFWCREISFRCCLKLFYNEMSFMDYANFDGLW